MKNRRELKWVVRLEGGLGNQMFQYAHARALLQKYGGELYFDLHAYDEKQARSLSLDNFNIVNYKTADNLSLPDRIRLKFLQAVHHFVAGRNFKNPAFMNGEKYGKLAGLGVYYQFQIRNFPSFREPVKRLNYVSGNYLTPEFFEGAENALRQEYQVKTPVKEECLGILEKIRGCNSVCMHVRLGDYLAPQWKDKLYICTEEYYRKAMDLVRERVEDPVFFVFSNRHKDIEWLKENFHLDGNVEYVDLGNPDFADFLLMYNCRHFIMSNSTYSWWAQWMGADPSKIVVAPSRFNNYPRWDVRDIYQEHWNLIEV